jgi:hypothetical protein
MASMLRSWPCRSDRGRCADPGSRHASMPDHSTTAKTLNSPPSVVASGPGFVCTPAACPASHSWAHLPHSWAHLPNESGHRFAQYDKTANLEYRGRRQAVEDGGEVISGGKGNRAMLKPGRRRLPLFASGQSISYSCYGLLAPPLTPERQQIGVPGNGCHTV